MVKTSSNKLYYMYYKFHNQILKTSLQPNTLASRYNTTPCSTSILTWASSCATWVSGQLTSCNLPRLQVSGTPHPPVLLHNMGSWSTERHRQPESCAMQGQICPESAPADCECQANATLELNWLSLELRRRTARHGCTQSTVGGSSQLSTPETAAPKSPPYLHPNFKEDILPCWLSSQLILPQDDEG